MTDDEIREKVARAIYEQFTLNWWSDRQGDEASGTTPPEPPSFDEAEPNTNWGDAKLYAVAYAKTALTACGYWEMRRALELVISYIDDPTPSDEDVATATNVVNAVRAALSKAGEA